MAFDLTKYGLGGDVLAQAQADYDADIAGLKTKNNELITSITDLKQASEQAQKDAEQEKHNAAKALAEKNNDVEAFKKALADEKIAMDALKLSFKETEDARVLDFGINDFSTVLSDDPAGRMYMQKQFKDSVEVVDGTLKPKDATIDLIGLTQRLVEDKANAKYIKQPVGSGGGSQGGQSGFSQAEPAKKVTSATSLYMASTQ